MPDAAEIIASPEIAKALHDLVVDSCNLFGGLKLDVARKMGMALVGQLETGAPVSSATRLVEAIRVASVSKARDILTADPPREFDNAADELFWLTNVVQRAVAKLD